MSSRPPTPSPETSWPASTRAPSGSAQTGDGVSVAYYELGGSGPALLLVHATGFCGPVLGPMTGHLEGRFRCVTLDLRAHGASAPPGDFDFSWTGFATDVLAVVDELGLEHPIGFGHSCGGAALLLAEEARPGTFAGLYCYEPIVYPGDVPLAPGLESNPLAAGALRRRQHFDSREDALGNFSAKPPFDALAPEVLAAYVDNGFEPGDDGGIRLRCRREHEAQTYAHALSNDAYARLGHVRCPVTLACGARTDAIGPDFLALFAARLAAVEQLVLPDVGHFGPLEDPAALSASVAGSLAAGAAAS